MNIMEFKKIKYFIPIYGLFHSLSDKNDLLNDNEDDLFKFAWCFCHLILTVPLMVFIIFMIILLFL